MSETETTTYTPINNTIYKHSIKLDKTANGYRINVHVYGNDIKDTVKELFQLLEETRKEAKKRDILIVTMDQSESNQSKDKALKST